MNEYNTYTDASPTTHPRHDERKSGRATFDPDGRSVWEWQVSTGVFTRTITEDQLLELAQANLELADDSPAAAHNGASVYPLNRRAGLSHPSQSRRQQPSGGSQGPMRRLFQRLTRAV